MEPFGAKTTADEVARSAYVAGKTIIVTGGSAGMGLETVRVLANAGADVLMCCRDVDHGKKMKQILEHIAGDTMRGSITVHALDLEDLENVKKFHDSIATKFPHVHMLICNAGAVGFPKTITRQGFEKHMVVNHFAHVYLVNLLMPKLKASGTTYDPARIVVVSSRNHTYSKMRQFWSETENLRFERRNYHPVLAYSDAKLANVLYVRELSKKLTAEGAPVMVVALHPGLVRTKFTNSSGFGGYVTRFAALCFGKSVAQGAATAVYAATAPGIPSGSYLEDCAVSKPSAVALDDDFAREFRVKSEELLREAIRSMPY